MRTLNTLVSMFFVAILVLSGCGSGSGVIEPPSDLSNDAASANCGPTVFAVIDFVFDPVSREGEAVFRSKTQAFEEEGFYDDNHGTPDDPWTHDGVLVKVKFLELDNSFDYTGGEPLPEFGQEPVPQGVWESIGGLVHRPDPSDAVFFSLTLQNTGIALGIHEPMAVLELDNPPAWPPVDDSNPDFEFPAPFLFNWDGLIDWPYEDALCWDPDNPLFTPCYHPYKFFADDHLLSMGQSEEKVLIVTLDNGSYEPVSWTTYIVGYDDDPPDTVPLEIETPFEDPDEPLVINVDPFPQFRVGVRFAEDEVPAGLRVVLDLSQWGQYSEMEYDGPDPDPSKPNVHWWRSEDGLTLPPPIHNKVYFVPVIVYQQLGGAPPPTAGPNQADFFILPRQRPDLDNDLVGHYMVSYLAQDPSTGAMDVFVQNTFTDERTKISEDEVAENFHTISADGSRVVWGNNAGEVYLWGSTAGRFLLDSAWFQNLFNYHVETVGVPVISPDGKFVVMQVNWEDSEGYSRSSALIADISVGDPGSIRWLAIRLWTDILWFDTPPPANAYASISAPWISGPIKFTAPELPLPTERDGYMVCFPYIPPTIQPDVRATPRIAVCVLNTHLLGGDDMGIETKMTKEVLAGTGCINPDPSDLSLGSIFHPGYSESFARCSIVMRDYAIGESNTGMLTYEAEEQGSNQAYRAPIEFGRDSDSNPNAQYVLGYGGNPDPFVPGGIIGGIAVQIGNPTSSESNCFFAFSALQSEGDGAFSVVRDGLERDSEIWLDYEDLRWPNMPPIPRGHFSLSSLVGLGGANVDAPTISQGEFSLLGPDPEAPYPAVAFDSQTTSTSDIYYAHWTGFVLVDMGGPEHTYKATMVLKRLTYGGVAIFPRLSGRVF